MLTVSEAETVTIMVESKCQAGVGVQQWPWAYILSTNRKERGNETRPVMSF